MPQAILFLDLDGTVRKGLNELGHYVNKVEDVHVFPEVIPLITWWDNQKGPVVGITNQGGVGLGYMTPEMNDAINDETDRQCGRLFAQIRSCIHRPDEDCVCRKPRTGMVYDTLQDYPEINVNDCLLIGDMLSDKECAEKAGTGFQWAEMWRANGFTR